MSEEKQRDEWGRLSQLLATIHTVATGKPHAPAKFNPFAKKERVKPFMTVSIRDLRSFFMGGIRLEPQPGLIGGGTTPADPSQFIRRR